MVGVEVEVQMLLVQPPLPVHQHAGIVQVLVIGVVGADVVTREGACISGQKSPSVLDDLHAVEDVLLHLKAQERHIVRADVKALHVVDRSLHGVGGVGVIGGAVFAVHLHRAVGADVVPVFRGVVAPLIPEPVVQRFLLFVAQLGHRGCIRALCRIGRFLRFRAGGRLCRASSAGRKADAPCQQQAQGSDVLSLFHRIPPSFSGIFVQIKQKDPRYTFNVA